MASELQKKTQSLCTAKDMRDATQMVMKPYANWEEYLTPAPLSVAIMGELVYISSCTDFSINKNPPIGGYQYIKYPDSFQACLMQVCHSGWWAFSEAHRSMDQIRLHTSTVPNYLKNVVTILFSEEKINQARLRNELETIQDIANDCEKLASEAETGFDNIIHLVQELLEACNNSQSCYGKELAEVQSKLEAAKINEKIKRDYEKKCTKFMEKMEMELDKAQKQYEKAMDSMPKAWDVIAMDLAEGLVCCLTSIMNSMTAMAAHTAEHINRKGHKDEVTGDDSDVIDNIGIYCVSGGILTYTNSIGKYIEQNKINFQSLFDQKEQKSQTDVAADQLNYIKNTLGESPNCKAKDEALNLCDTGINICQQLAEYAPKGECSEEKANEIISKWQKLNISALAFDSASKNTTKSPSMTGNPPMMNKSKNHAEAFGRAAEIAYFRIEQTRAQLDKAREQHYKCVDKMEKNKEELADILNTMRECNLQEIDFNTTIKMLIKGMDAMGRVKAQWEKMVRFFQMVSSIVKVSLSKGLTRFVKDTGETAHLYNTHQLSTDMLYEQIFQATNIASLVHMISETYTEVSNKYLLDSVSSLSTLMALDKSQPEFQKTLMKLRNGCKEAEKEILDLVRKNKREFDRNADARLERIEGELLAILPPAPPEKKKAIKEAVQSGFSKEELNDLC